MIGVFEMQTIKCDHFKVNIPDINLITEDLTPDAAAFVEAAAKINPWSTLVHILSPRAYRSLRANLSPTSLAVSAAVPAGLVAAVLTRRDHRVLLQREFSRIILTGGAVAAAVPFAALVWAAPTRFFPTGCQREDFAIRQDVEEGG